MPPRQPITDEEFNEAVAMLTGLIDLVFGTHPEYLLSPNYRSQIIRKSEEVKNLQRQRQ